MQFNTFFRASNWKEACQALEETAHCPCRAPLIMGHLIHSLIWVHHPLLSSLCLGQRVPSPIVNKGISTKYVRYSLQWFQCNLHLFNLYNLLQLLVDGHIRHVAGVRPFRIWLLHSRFSVSASSGTFECKCEQILHSTSAGSCQLHSQLQLLFQLVSKFSAAFLYSSLYLSLTLYL